jgi:hypothetical protein
MILSLPRLSGRYGSSIRKSKLCYFNIWEEGRSFGEEAWNLVFQQDWDRGTIEDLEARSMGNEVLALKDFFFFFFFFSRAKNPWAWTRHGQKD